MSCQYSKWIFPSCSDMDRAIEELPLMKDAIAEFEFTESEMISASTDRNSHVSRAMRCRTSLMLRIPTAVNFYVMHSSI